MSTTQAAALYQLQQLDLELERLTAEQQALAHSLQEDTVLSKARAEAQMVQQQLGAAQQAQKQAEQALEELSERLRILDQRLYGGMITNAKELQALQQEAQYLRTQKDRQEDLILEMMDATETLEISAQQKSEQLQRLEQAWQQRNAGQLAHRAQLDRKLLEAQQRRARFASTLDGALLARYEALRRSRQGRAVSRVEQSSCQWCRVLLTASEIQRARASQELQACSNCGRILYFDR
jgi:predicted  nucleic acid-binding Zn-ribbon protein